MLAKQIAESLAGASFIRKMFEEGNRLRAQVGPERVSDFSLGNPHLEPPAEVTQSLADLANTPPPGLHRYMPNTGFPEVRRRIAEWLSKKQNVTLPAEHVTMSCGAAGGLVPLFRALLNPGDEVIVFAPYFPEYRWYALHAGASICPVETTEKFELDPEAVRRSIGPRTRAVLLNSPNNPTGRVYGTDSIERLCDVLREANAGRTTPIVLVADEPYRKLTYEGEVPTLLDRYDTVALVVSFSKDLGLAGERIGYVALGPNFPQVGEVLAGLAFCLRTLGFVNAPATMQQVVARSLDASVDVEAYRANRDRLYDGLVGMGYRCVRPEGAFFLFPEIPAGVGQSAAEREARFMELLREEYILAVPGSGFGRAGYFRLSYAVEPEVIDRALPGFVRALAAMKA